METKQSERETLMAELGLVPFERQKLTPQQVFFAMVSKPVIRAQVELQDYLRKIGMPPQAFEGLSDYIANLESALRQSLTESSDEEGEAWTGQIAEWDELWPALVRATGAEVREEQRQKREQKWDDALDKLNRIVETLRRAGEPELVSEMEKVQEETQKTIERQRAAGRRRIEADSDPIASLIASLRAQGADVQIHEAPIGL